MRKIRKYLYGLLGIALFIACWQLICYIKQDPALISAEKIAKAFVRIVSDKSFYKNLFSTLKIVLIGVSLGVTIGIVLGVLMDLSERISNTVSPLIDMLRNIPSITLFPILLVLYGIGDGARIFVIFWTACPAVVLATVHGLKSVDNSIVEAAQVFGANKLQIMRKIKLPLAMPEILNGIKIGTGSGFVAIVVAEMLGASKGLGFMVLWATNSFKYDETYAYIIIIALIGAMVNFIMNIIINKYERELL